jgi:sec-independent protein translocase protein TatA
MNTILLGIIGGQEVLLIFLVALLLFGGKKIPELMKGLGQGIREFKKAASDSEVGKDLKDIKKEVNSVSQDIKDSARL